MFYRHIDNSYTYYFDVQETEKEDPDMTDEETEEKKTVTVRQAYSIPITGNLHLDNIKKEVMQYLWSTDEENRLINLYNSGVNKLLGTTEENTAAKNMYKTFLTERIDVLNKVEEDYKTGIV